MANPGGVKFGIWLRSKRNFYLYWITAVGIPMWVLFTWSFGEYGGALWLVFLAVVAFGAALLSAFAMWHFFRWYFPSMHNGGRED